MKTPDTPEARRQALRDLAEQIGHDFHDLDLLGRALVHSSMGNEGKRSYERLEFLGDAVLGFLVADHLYGLEPEVPEGALTDRRAKFVAREPLAEAARRLGLVRYIEAGRGLRQAELESPRIQADLLEAVLGAVYVDGGIRCARSFVAQHVIQALGDPTGIHVARDPKSRLLHRAQGRGLGQPAYSLIDTEGPDHDRTFTVLVRVDQEDLATGKGKSKQKAEMEAAEQGLLILHARDRDQDEDAAQQGAGE